MAYQAALRSTPHRDVQTVSRGAALVGKILEKRYVVLEEVGPDGTGFRYLVYDMNSLQRIHLRVDPDSDGQLSGNTFELVDIDQPLVSSASAEASSASPEEVEQPRPRNLTPRGFHPTSKDDLPPEQHTVRLPREVALEAASTDASPKPLTLLEELKATGKDPDSDPNADGPLVERPLAEALDLALKAASTMEPAETDPLTSTQPIDLASAEEIAQLEPPAQSEPLPAAAGERPRVQTKVLEAAWFAQGDQMDEEEEIPTPEAPVVDHNRLARQAAELSADEYRKYALDLPPPAPPPIRIVEAFLDAKPDLASLVSPVVGELGPEPASVRPRTPTPAPTTAPALQRSLTPPPTAPGPRLVTPTPPPVAPVAPVVPVPQRSMTPTPRPATPTPRPTTPTPPPQRSVTPTPPPARARTVTPEVSSPTKPDPDLGSAPTVASLPPLDQILNLAPAAAPPAPETAEPPAPPPMARTEPDLAPPAIAPKPVPPPPSPVHAPMAPVAPTSMAWSATRPTSRPSSISEHALGSRLGTFVIGLLVGSLVGSLGTCLLTPRIPPAASAPPAVVAPPVVKPPVATPERPRPEPTRPTKVEDPPPTAAPSLNGRERKRLNHMVHLAARFARRHRWKQARHYAIKALQVDPAHRRAHRIKSHAEQMLGIN